MSFDINNDKIQIEKNGKVIDCDILFTFNSKETKKNYIGYTDGELASNGRKNIYVSAFNPLNPKVELEDITDPKELKMVNDVLEKINDEVAG